MGDRAEVKTDVDRLISLVAERKEISVEEAAKSLDIPVDTIESLSSLMEEEGMVELKYKFTTPYLCVPKHAERAEKAVVKKEDILEEAPAEVAEKYIELPEIEEKAEKEAKKEIKPRKEKIELPKKEDELLRLAEEYLQKGDIEKAREVYLEIKKIRHVLPDEYAKREESLGKDIIKLNEEITSAVDRQLSSSFNEKYNQIEDLLVKANSAIIGGKIATQKDLEMIEGYYKAIRNIYMELPQGFMEKKLSAQERMLNLYKTIILNRKNILTEEFKRNSQKITELMKDIAGKIQEKDIDRAHEIFEKISVMYKTLPEGFLKEKTSLQNDILEIYQRLILTKEKEMTASLMEKRSEINSLFSQAKEALARQDIKTAEQLYDRISGLYSKLPKGDLDVRAEIEEMLVDLRRNLSASLRSAAKQEMSKELDEIERLITTVEEYLAKDEPDFAKEAYEEVIRAYNKLPEGYLEQHMQLQNKLIQLYKKIIEAVPASFEEDGARKKYDELLDILVDIHTHIKKKEFGHIKSKYLMAYKIYHELPLGVIEKKSDLHKELAKTYHELNLYMKVKRLDDFAQRRDFEGLNNALHDINSDYMDLIKKYPEDIEIFRYIRDRYMVYLSVIKSPEIPSKERIKTSIKEISRASDMPRPDEILVRGFMGEEQYQKALQKLQEVNRK